ncbi:stage II sporulation protein P [Bacillus chungangensis]|uniref:Uncharacterized protein n=1 Tax=Bacillus chungangensis TaxID=587633 RepID=A0ABT9WTT1_9BACI|nr:hypothetical protein [Bacillus chungangensis]
MKLDIVEMKNDANLTNDKMVNMSREKIADAVKNNVDAHMFLDIQQEPSFMPKDKTTAKVEGKNVARILFISIKIRIFILLNN